MNEIWDNLKLSHVGLPSKLRPAQSDALHWLSQDKSVVICVGTGSGKTLVALTNTLLCPSWSLSLCIFPLVAIEQQCAEVCKSWDIPFLSLDEVDPKDITEVVEAMEPKPRVILCTISTVSTVPVQAQIRRLPVKTICLDEVQVVNSDEKIGWGGFLPYWQSLWDFFFAAFPKVKYLLASATLTDSAVRDILGSLHISRQSTMILFKPPDRSNIHLQVREHSFNQDDDHEPLLSFILPMLADKSGLSIQMFFQSKFLLNKASSFFKTAAEDLNLESLKWETIMKLTGEKSRPQKQRVVDAYREGLVVFLEGSDLPIFRSVRALLSTSAGSMGLDVPGTRLVVIHSAPKTAWEFSQEMGRAGRGGDQSVCIFLRKKGERTPPEMKPYLRQDSSACLKRGMVEIFTLRDADVVYPFEQEVVNCSGVCITAGRCQCTKCLCCSKCASTCLQCPLKLKLGADQVVAAILGLGDESFKIAQKAMETRFSAFSWLPTGVFSTPTLTRSQSNAFLQARARRGRGLTLQGAPMRPTLLQRLARNEDEEEEEEAGYLADLHL